MVFKCLQLVVPLCFAGPSLLRRALPRVSSQMDQSVGQTDQDIGEALRDIVVRVLLLPVIWAECTPNAE